MARTLLKTRTARSGIMIEQQGSEKLLRFERDGDAIQSRIDTAAPHRLTMENLSFLMGILLFIPPPQRILVLGVGGGALIHYIQHYLPECHVTGIEYDAELLQIAQAQMELPQASERLDYIIADARDFITRSGESWDLVLVDIFSGGRSPGWLLQKQTLEHIKRLLTPGGGVAFNLLLNGEKTFVEFYRRLRAVHRSMTLCLETEEYENLLIYGLNFTPARRSIEEWLAYCRPASDRYELPFNRILAKAFEINPVDAGII